MKTVLWPRSLVVLVLAGWMVLCQHVACGQTEYAGDGEPTAKEEEIRWLINRSRFSRSKENARRGSNYLDIPASSGPIAPNGRLTLAARRHAEDLATRNLFQHTTVPGSAYYDPSTHPNSWDRMTAEGYVWNLAGENIAAGYPSAGSVYVGWWHSTGHRLNMFNRNFTEIGNGHFFRAASTYKDYYAMSLGRSGSNRFFTGTLFQDLNGNKGYNQGEGRGGVKVELVVGGAKHSVCDTSTAVGSFAIPLAGIAEGETVRVVLTNTTNESITVSVPRNYDVLESIVMGPSESRPWGQFVRANDDLNYGFSDVGVPVEFIVLLPSEGEHGAESGIGYTFAVAANVAWTSSSNSTWLRVTGGQTGTDVGTVTYEMDANPFGDPRVGLISLIGDANVVKTFQVTQAGLPTTLGVNPTEMNVGSDGGSGLGITVNANVTWRATKTVHWIQFSGGSEAVGDGTFGLNVSPNTGSVAREAVVTIRGGSETRLVTVRQEAGAVRRVGETFALNASEGAGTVQKVSGLPSGVVFDRLTGQITGRPTQAGIFLVKMDVLGVGGVEKRVLTLTVSALPVSAVGSFEMGLARAAGLGNGLGGVLNFTTTTSGSVSGTLRMVGKTHSWRGLVEHATGMAPEVVATVLRSKEEPVTLRITLNSDHRATGAATPGAAGVAVGVEGWKRVWAIRTAEVSPAMVGSMNVLFDLKAAWENDISVPQGSGYAVMTVAKDGRLTWSGRMPDGAVLVRSGWLGPSGEGAFWSALHGVQGSVMGGGVCAINGTFTGNLDWVKKGPASSSDRTYASGFGVDMRGPVGLTMFGEIWQTPAKGLALLDVLGLSEGPENLQLEFVGGVQADTVAPVADLRPTLTRQNKLNLPIPGDVGNPNRVIVRIYPTSGRVTGEFTLTDAPIGGIGAPVKRQVFFNGLKLPKSVEAGGYFLGRKRVTAPQPTEMLSGAIWMTK